MTSVGESQDGGEPGTPGSESVDVPPRRGSVEGGRQGAARPEDGSQAEPQQADDSAGAPERQGGLIKNEAAGTGRQPIEERDRDYDPDGEGAAENGRPVE